MFPVPRHCFADCHHLTQVRRTIVTRRRTDSNKQHLAMLHREFFIAGELQTTGVQAFAHQAGQPRFENAHVALLQQLDFFLVDVHADHVVAHFSQDGRLHQANVAATQTH